MGNQEEIEKRLNEMIAAKRSGEAIQREAENKSQSEFDVALSYFRSTCMDVVRALKSATVSSRPITGKTNVRLLGAQHNRVYRATQVDEGWVITSDDLTPEGRNGRCAISTSGKIYFENHSGGGSAATYNRELWDSHSAKYRGGFMLRYKHVPDYIQLPTGGEYYAEIKKSIDSMQWKVSNHAWQLDNPTDVELIENRPYLKCSQRLGYDSGSIYRSVEAVLIENCAKIIGKNQGRI